MLVLVPILEWCWRVWRRLLR